MSQNFENCIYGTKLERSVYSRKTRKGLSEKSIMIFVCELSLNNQCQSRRTKVRRRLHYVADVTNHATLSSILVFFTSKHTAYRLTSI